MSSYDSSDNDISQNEIKDELVLWYEDPNILLKNINEIFPLGNMEFNRKINALTRLIIILTFLAYLFGQSIKYLISGILSLVFVYFYSLYCNKENFELYKDYIEENDLENPDVFQPPTSTNPFSNVLISDIKYNPDKKAALPAYEQENEYDINNKVKDSIQEMNPDLPNIKDKLFKDLGEEMAFEQSMRQFYSNPSTTIPNDQTAFANFCYGNMTSCKEGNSFACGKYAQNYDNL
tara:strand:+ start:163 stop:867 length:705 start_codon:yes stop_codon:yes gene_type:complete